MPSRFEILIVIPADIPVLGGDQAAIREPDLLNPATDGAKIRGLLRSSKACDHDFKLRLHFVCSSVFVAPFARPKLLSIRALEGVKWKRMFFS